MSKKNAKQKAKKRPNVNKRWDYSAAVEYRREQWNYPPKRRGTSNGKHKPNG